MEKKYTELELNEHLDNANLELIGDIVKQLTDKKACVFCMNDEAHFTDFEDNDGSNHHIYLCSICLGKIRWCKEFIQEIFERDK